MGNFIEYQRYANTDDALDLVSLLSESGIDYRVIDPKPEEGVDFDPYHKFTTLLIKEKDFNKVQQIEAKHYKVNFDNISPQDDEESIFKGKKHVKKTIKFFDNFIH